MTAAVSALAAAVFSFLVVGGPVWLASFVAAATEQGTPTGYVSAALLSAGVTALGVVLSGKIVVPTFAYNREKERADKWETEVIRLNASIADRHVPALDSASHAIAESTEMMKRGLEALARRQAE